MAKMRRERQTAALFPRKHDGAEVASGPESPLVVEVVTPLICVGRARNCVCSVCNPGTPGQAL